MPKLQGGDRYIQTLDSLAFPNLSITELIPTLVEHAIKYGTRKMLRSLKAQFPKLN